MVLAPVKCPYCGSTDVKKYGTADNGKQRYACGNTECSHKTFIIDYSCNACDPYIKERIFFSTVNRSGIRATARMLGISKNTVPATLKTVELMLWYVNANYFENHDNNDDIDIELVLIDEAETDEMWSYVHDKSQQCRLWWAIDRNTGEPLAFHFGTLEQKNLDELLKLLKPFKINVVCSDDNFAYKKRN